MSLPIFNKPKILGYILKKRDFNYTLFSIYKNLNKYIAPLILVYRQNNFKIDTKSYNLFVQDGTNIQKDFYLNLIVRDVLRYTKNEVTFSFLICFEKTNRSFAHKIYKNLDLKKSMENGIGEILIIKYVKKDNNEIELFSVDNEDKKFLYKAIYSK